MKKVMRMLLGGILTLAMMLSVNTSVFAAEVGGKTECDYQATNYDQSILDCLSLEMATELQQQVDEIRRNQPDVTDDELNVFIMDNIEEAYYAKKMSRSYDVPYLKDKLNATEKNLFASNPTKGLYAVSAANTATTWAANLFTEDFLFQGNGDAYRYSMWQAILAKAYGSAYAKQWGDAHEVGCDNATDSTMDLRNNAIGRNVGVALTGNQSVEARLSSTLLQKISSGQLWRIVNGLLCATDGTGRK